MSPAEVAAWRARRIADGTLIEVRAEGWSGTQLALGADADLLRDLDAGVVPAAWAPLETTSDEEVVWLAPLDPVSARGRAKTVFGFDYTWEIYTPVHKRRWGRTRCRSCGATGSSRGWTRGWTGRPARS